jgi:hypothetical protein
MQLFALFAGLFVVSASVLDWDWFFNNSKAMFFVNLWGRRGARLFYLVLGVVLLLLSYYFHAYVKPGAL